MPHSAAGAARLEWWCGLDFPLQQQAEKSQKEVASMLQAVLSQVIDRVWTERERVMSWPWSVPLSATTRVLKRAVLSPLAARERIVASCLDRVVSVSTDEMESRVGTYRRYNPSQEAAPAAEDG